MNSENDPHSDPVGNPSSEPDSHDEKLTVKKSTWFRKSFNPFRIATLRGLGVVLPPLLTIMLFAWAWNTIDRTILQPVEALSEHWVARAIEDIRENDTIQNELRSSPSALSRLKQINGHQLYTTSDGTALIEVNNQWMPQDVFALANAKSGELNLKSAHDYYKRYVQIRYLKRHLFIPAILAVFLAIMYLVGKLLAAGIGRIFWHAIESLIQRLPIIRNVYSSVKQVTDFAFSENEVQFTRVVAIEYPRKGLWSIGFVTGESLADIRKAAGEPMLSVLMPTSPMPATGFTVTVPKSETIELNITIDQAIQFCVSCGVVTPDHQMAKSSIEGEVRRRSGAPPIAIPKMEPLDSTDNLRNPDKE